MTAFMGEDFLLRTKAARRLYEAYAERMPIIDYHCHLSPEEIADNIAFPNIGRLMLGGDHYKWRAMSAYGFGNDFIRRSDDWDRFLAYAKAMPMMLGNPLYHWTHLELKRVFDIDESLSEKTAKAIWDRAGELLKKPEYRAKGLIERFHVKVVCTTDDPVDDLRHHARIAQDKAFSCKVLPAFRPDKAVNADRAGFSEYMEKLEAASGVTIRSTQDVIRALEKRVQYFHDRGARLSDHALDNVPFAEPDMALADKALLAGRAGEKVDPQHLEHYRTALLLALGGMYQRRGWVQQYHMNALRNVNTTAFKRYGPDTGFDSLTDALQGEKLAKLLDHQEQKGELPKTILYTLNPAANYALAAIAGSFQGGVPGRVQFGSAWWFCDQYQGMLDQMTALASVGLISTFVGMLTDSRCFLSYSRHEYFRRIFCDLMGDLVERGEYPDDEDALGRIIRGICYENARDYFDFGLDA